MMGEIDTKPIDSVQTALSFFDQGIDHRKNSPKKDEEAEKERDEQETLERQLANMKLQLEAKDSAYKQALHKIEQHHKTADELSTLLKNSDLQKDFYIIESREAKLRINELESSLNQISLHLSESKNAQEHLMHVTNDFESAQAEIKNMESELAVLREAEIEHLSQIQAMGRDLNEVKLQKEEILNQVSELNQLKEDMQMQKKKNLDQAGYITLLETELKQLRTEVEKSKEEENEAQVEIALLKFEVHKARSKLATAEVAESRAQSEKSALYNALQQMGIEAEETKKENKLLKEAMKEINETQEQEEENEDHLNDHEDGKEVESVKRELELATAKIGELRTRAEQAISRAEEAEKMKAELEEKIKRRIEQRDRRKAALAALREESISRNVSCAKSDASVKNYQPLGKVLNMKF